MKKKGKGNNEGWLGREWNGWKRDVKDGSEERKKEKVNEKMREWRKREIMKRMKEERIQGIITKITIQK